MEAGVDRPRSTPVESEGRTPCRPRVRSARLMLGKEKARMPTYEFHCNACGKDFTTIMTFAARRDETVKCPECASSDVEQAYTSVSVKTGKKTW